MNVEVLRKRLTARLTSPPEILYALTRHWIMLCTWLAIGTLVMMAKVLTDPDVYESKATLILNSGDTMLVDQDRRSEFGRDDTGRFFASRVEILTSDTVLRNIVEELKAGRVLSQDANPEEKDYGVVRLLLTTVKDKFSQVVSLLEHSDALDQSAEAEIQRAVTAFRRRITTNPNARTSSVEVRVYGNDREMTLKELQSWIDAYTGRLVAMAEESREIFINSRTRFWQKKVDDAREVLEGFKKEHPEVSKVAQELLLQQIFRLEMRKEELQRELQFGPTTLVVEEPKTKDPTIISLRQQRLELERKLVEATPLHGENSEVVRYIKECISIVDAKLKGLDVTGGDDPDQRKAALRDQIEKLNQAISADRARHATNGIFVEQLLAYEADLKRAQDTFQNYRLMSVEETDRGELRKTIQVQVGDRPTVSWKPYNVYPLRQVGLGAVAGAVLGVVLAVVVELLRSRVRFKSDIVSELGLSVVGVIPRK